MQPVCKMNWLYLLHIRMTEMREEQLLQAAGIKPTAARILIIRNLDAADHPLSMAEIGDALETVDKSVISRTLALFRTARLLHIIQDGSDSVRYELCRCHCSVSGGRYRRRFGQTYTFPLRGVRQDVLFQRYASSRTGTSGRFPCQFRQLCDKRTLPFLRREQDTHSTKRISTG